MNQRKSHSTKTNSGAGEVIHSNASVGSNTTNDADKESKCQKADCECYLRRGQMFLPPNLLQTLDEDDKR